MITITNITAMKVWAYEGLLESVGSPCSAQGLRWSAESAHEVWQSRLELLGIEATKKDPVHILVDSPSARICSERVCNHVWSGRIPPGSLYQLAPGILITSPGFCCLQEAARSSVPRVTKMLMECLGQYGLSDDARGFLDRSPLLTLDEFRGYLDGARGSLGVRKARRALSLALPMSRSPLETKTAIILTFPSSHGGFGLLRPEMNYVIHPKAEDIPFSQFARYEVDLCWPGRKTVIEVDSYRYHSDASRLDSDAKKRNSLKSMGWKVVSVTDGQLSGDALGVLARQVAKDLWMAPEDPETRLRDWLASELS